MSTTPGAVRCSGDQGGRVRVSARDSEFAAGQSCLVVTERWPCRERPIDADSRLVESAGRDQHQRESRMGQQANGGR